MADEEVVRDLLDDARALISEGDWGKAVALLTALHPADLADLVLSLEEERRREFLDHLPTDITAQLFEYAEDDELRDLIRGVGVADLPAVLEEAEADVAADVIQQLGRDDREETLAALDRDEVTDLLQYSDESAGGIMSTGFVSLPEDVTVQQAIDYLRVLRPPSEKAYYIYVVDRDQRLQGTVSIRDLIVSSPRTTLGEITQHDVHAVTTGTDQEQVARTLQRYNLMAVPVVDEEGRLEGVTSADDLFDVAQEEATEDMYRMVGLDEDESTSNRLLRAAWLRLPWLVVNLGTAFVATFILIAFNGTVERAAILFAFAPAIANQAGVTGTQTSTIMVRALALGEARRSLAWIVVREAFIGMGNGFVVGLLLAGVGLAVEQNLTLSLILLVSMTGASTLAAPIGQLVPIALKVMRADPALSSSIFVTMFTDGFSYLFCVVLGAALISRLQA